MPNWRGLTPLCQLPWRRLGREEKVRSISYRIWAEDLRLDRGPEDPLLSLGRDLTLPSSEATLPGSTRHRSVRLPCATGGLIFVIVCKVISSCDLLILTVEYYNNHLAMTVLFMLQGPASLPQVFRKLKCPGVGSSPPTSKYC